MRTTIEIIQKVRIFLNFRLVEKRQQSVEKKKSSRCLRAACMTTRVGYEEASPRIALPETTIRYFWISKEVSRAAKMAQTTYQKYP